MPRQGQSVESCILTELRVKKGDMVAPGDVLFAYETDKASFEEEAREEGTVLEIFFGEGDEIPVLTNVLVIGKPGERTDEFRPGGAAAVPAAAAEEVEKASAPAPEKEEISKKETASQKQAAEPLADDSRGKKTEPQAAAEPQTVYDGGSVAAVSPRARGLARRCGIDAAHIRGSGPGGRVIAGDIAATIEVSPRTTPLAKARMQEDGLARPQTGTGLAGAVRSADLVQAANPANRTANATAAKTTADAAAQEGDSYVKPLTNMRKLIARSMHASLQNSAQLTHHLGADARRIMELRKQAKSKEVNVTINDLVCYGVIRALEKFPSVNAHFLGIDKGVRYFNGVHLALAVDTERGLMVPVVRNADRLSIAGLAGSLREVAEACRKGSINPDLLSPEAAGFTVSNLGNYGVEIFTPVINLPQVAILGVNTIVPRPKDLGGGVYAFVPYIGLSLTYDHRALDGGEATRFLKRIAVELETLDVEL